MISMAIKNDYTNILQTEKTTQEILKYLTKTLPEKFPQDIQENNPTIIEQFKKFAEEAKALLNKITIAKNNIRKTLNSSDNYKTQKAAQGLLVVYTKGYAFYQKLRQFITGEKLEYLLLFDDKDSARVGKFSLTDLVPTLALVIKNENSFSLGIKNVQEFINLKNKIITGQNAISEGVEEEIIGRYGALRALKMQDINKERKKRQDKKYYEFGMQGFAFEGAVKTVGKGKITRKAYKRDFDANYRGADLMWKKNEVHSALADKNTNLELKRLSTSANAVGAGLVNDKTIEMVLKIISSFSINFQKDAKKMQKILKNGLFQRKNNISASLENAIINAVGPELDKLVNALISK